MQSDSHLVLIGELRLSALVRSNIRAKCKLLKQQKKLGRLWPYGAIPRRRAPARFHNIFTMADSRILALPADAFVSESMWP